MFLADVNPLLKKERLWRRGRRWSAIAFPFVCDQATLLRLLALEHPTRVARACKAVDSIDRSLDDTLRCRREGVIGEM